MLTVAETDIFNKQSLHYWNEEERLEFVSFIAQHHDKGAVIPQAGGVRKIRWASKGKGKRGGVRVVYFNMLEDGKLWLLLIYGKNVRENIPAHILKQVKEELTS